ncbi:ArsR/SmtB family transcription factor [Chitinophaga lutea]
MNAALDVFQVVADPGRRHMLMLLSKERMTINELAENFDMSRPAVSKHVKILHEAGFISIEDEGRSRFCTIRQDGFRELQEWISYFDRFWQQKMENLGALMEKRERRRK